MQIFLIILLVLQGIGILFKAFYIIGSFYEEEADNLSAYCLFSIWYSIAFEVGFAICLGVL